MIVSKVLEIGWNNISKRAHSALRDGAEGSSFVGLLNREGWILHVPSSSSLALEPSLQAALELARMKGCSWLLIGVGAREISELSIYESDEDLDDDDFLGNSRG